MPAGAVRHEPLTSRRDHRRGVPVPTRVVIAEDEAIIRLDLKETLEEEGYEVVGETGRGDEAVELVRELEPDVAILDIKMPGLDGLSAAREIAGERLRRGADPHRLQPARPHRAGPRRRRAGLPGQAVPAQRAGPGHRGGHRPLPRDAGAGRAGRDARGAARDPQGGRPGQGPADGRARPDRAGDAFAFIQKTAMRERAHHEGRGRARSSPATSPPTAHEPGAAAPPHRRPVDDRP